MTRFISMLLVAAMIFSIIPATVQGSDAPRSLVSALNKAKGCPADLIIIGRGGGSVEDLQAFNSEEVARAVFASDVPVISAVGHETDFTIADFVADLRAPTPSAAAELAVPDISLVGESLSALKKSLYEKVCRKISACEKELLDAVRQRELHSPEGKIKRSAEAAEQVYSAIRASFGNVIGKKEQQLEKREQVLEAINPFRTLARGYAIVYKNGKPVTDADMLSQGDLISVKLSSGCFEAVVGRKGKEVEDDL